MAHKTLIGGTDYEISGGKTLVNGTAYSIDKGKTLVGGTAYEIPFQKEMITFTIHSMAAQGDVTFTAEEGMTWAQFIESEYNPSHSISTFTIDTYGGTECVHFEQGPIMYGSERNYDLALPSEEIIAGYYYEVS